VGHHQRHDQRDHGRDAERDQRDLVDVEQARHRPADVAHIEHERGDDDRDREGRDEQAIAEPGGRGLARRRIAFADPAAGARREQRERDHADPHHLCGPLVPALVAARIWSPTRHGIAGIIQNPGVPPLALDRVDDRARDGNAP